MEMEKLFADFQSKTEDTLNSLVNASKEETKLAIDALNEEITSLKGKMSESDSLSDESARKKIITDAFASFKEISKTNWSYTLKSAIDAAFLNETVATEWKELVIAEFARDVIQVMAEFAIIDNVKNYSTSSNNKSIRVYANWSTTSYVAPWTVPTVSKGATSVINFTVADAKTLVQVEDNLLDDVAETYAIIVRDIAQSQESFKETQIMLWDGTGLNRTGVMENVGITEIADTGAGNISISLLTAVETDDYLDTIVNAMPAELERDAKWYLSKYEIGILKKLRDTNGNKLYPSLETKEKNLKGYDVVTVKDKVITSTATDVASARNYLLGNFAEGYAEVSRKDFDIQAMYLSNDQAAGVQSLLAVARHTGWVIINSAFVVGINGINGNNGNNAVGIVNI
jgi:HK97 family phage major capsid protein